MEVDDDEAFATPPSHGTPTSSNPPGFHEEHRVYDDDDEAFQAALRASLEDVPPGFRIPSPPPRPERPPAPAVPEPAPPQPQVDIPQEEHEPDTETESETESNILEQPEEVSMEEMRRRRLARFGG